MSNKKLKKIIESIKFNEQGLAPAIIQDYKTNKVLMLAYMNKEALLKTLSTKKTHFYSRSRKKLWMKGEQSGNVQKVKDVYIDCDSDCILIKVNQVGKAACHTGYESCFYRKITKDFGFKIVDKKIFDPQKVYK
ncbi:MAG: phosphoribosyl-AMP cyclohydrolase [Endomicrobiia bacterium]